MLRVGMRKIFLQQYLPRADIPHEVGRYTRAADQERLADGRSRNSADQGARGLNLTQ